MEAIPTAASAVRSESRSFYVWMAGAFLLVAFGGFVPTYWARVATGTFHAEPIIHIHGALLFTWTCFYFVQTALVASGRTLKHRAWGLAVFSPFPAPLLSGLGSPAEVRSSNTRPGLPASPPRVSTRPPSPRAPVG